MPVAVEMMSLGLLNSRIRNPRLHLIFRGIQSQMTNPLMVKMMSRQERIFSNGSQYRNDEILY